MPEYLDVWRVIRSISREVENFFFFSEMEQHHFGPAPNKEKDKKKQKYVTLQV